MNSHEFLNYLKSQLNLDLNDQQETAILHKDGPAVVLAVPGSGKTTVLICRIAHLVLCHSIQPTNILSVTFSRASAKDMEKRFSDLFSPIISEKVTFSTIHALAYRILNRYNSVKNIHMTLIEENNSSTSKYSLLRKIYK